MLYSPDGPCVFTSGKHAGKAVELTMFSNPGLLRWIHNRYHRESINNRLHNHLDWLLKVADEKQPKMICPQCNKKPVKYFSLLHSEVGISIGSLYTCCDEKECREKILYSAGGKIPSFYEFKFSVIAKFSAKVDERAIIKLFKQAYNLPKRLTKESAFKFFAN